MFLFFGIIGFVLCKSAKKIRANRENIKQYLAIIVDGGVYRLDSIAAARGKSYEAVKKDVQKMIQKGYLNKAYIDESTGKVVLLYLKVKEVKKLKLLIRRFRKRQKKRRWFVPAAGQPILLPGKAVNVNIAAFF